MTHLKENTLLELEVLSHDVCDVGRLDWEGDGYVRLLQDVVHLEMKKIVSVKNVEDKENEFDEVFGWKWRSWNMFHLENADNTAPDESRHDDDDDDAVYEDDGYGEDD